MNWQNISEQISTATAKPFTVINARSLAGGDINTAYCLQGVDTAYFVKLNRAEKVNMFAAEAAGLKELANTCTVKVPCPIVYGVTDAQAFLVLEYIEFGTRSKTSEHLLGQQLALLHQKQQPYFGWHQENTIGSTPQPNTKSENWLTFWQTQRLLHQLTLAAAHGYRGQLQKSGEQLCSRLSGFFQRISTAACPVAWRFMGR